jgi:hypothetical protein
MRSNVNLECQNSELLKMIMKGVLLNKENKAQISILHVSITALTLKCWHNKQIIVGEYSWFTT